MPQRGFAHIVLIFVLSIAILGVIVVSAIRNTNNQTDQMVTDAIPSPSPAVESSPSPVGETTSPTDKPATNSTPKNTTSPTIDKYNICGNYDRNTHPPLPAAGDAPLLVYLYGSGDSVYGISGFQWDFDGDGVWDTEAISSKATNKVSHVYKQSGQYNPKFRVVAANSSVSEVCSYPFTVAVESKPEFGNNTIMVDKLNFEYTISRSGSAYKFPWYGDGPSDYTLTIYNPAFRVSSKDKFTFVKTVNSSVGSPVYVYETGANLEPGTSYEFHFAISRWWSSGTYEGSVVVTYTTGDGTIVNNGPTINYKVTLTD